MTAKDLLIWKIEPAGGGDNTPLSGLRAQLQSQLAAAQFPGALKSLHDSLVFLTMFYGGVSTGSLRSVTPLGPELTLLLDEPGNSLRWNRLLQQAWQDWSRHPHHPALEMLRQVFFVASRLQSSRLGARRHTRWLGVEPRFPTNGETLASWSDTIRKAKNINPEAAARQLVNKLPLLNIWLRASKELFDNWTLRLDTTDPSSFRYLISREDCRFDTLPHFNSEPLIHQLIARPGGGFEILEAKAEVAPPAPVSESVPEKPTKPATDLGLQWDPATNSYKLTGTSAPKSAPEPQPAAAEPKPAAKASAVGVEWDPVSNSYKVVSPSPAPVETPTLAETKEPDSLDDLLQAELKSLEDLLSDEHIADTAKAGGKTPAQEEFTDLGFDFLMGESEVRKPPVPSAKSPLGPPPMLEDQKPEESASEPSPQAQPEETTTPVAAVESAPSLEDLLEETPAPVDSTPSLEDLLEETPAPSLEDLLDDTPAPVAAVETAPSLEDLLEEPPAPVAAVETAPSLEDLLEEPPAPVETAPSLEAMLEEPPTPAAAVETAPSLEDLLEEPPAPVAVVEAAPSLEDMLEEPPVPVAAVETAPSLEDLLEDTPAPVETAPSLEAMLEEPPTPVAAVETAPSLEDLLEEPPAPVAAPSLEDLLEDTPAPVETAPSLEAMLEDPPTPVAAVETAPSLEDLLEEPPAPVAAVETASSLEDLLEDTPAPVAVIETAPSLEDLLEETSAPVAAVETAPSLEDLLEDTPAPVAVLETAPSLEDLLEDTPAPVAVLETAPSLEDMLEEPPTPVAAIETAPSLEDLLEEPPALVKTAPSPEAMLEEPPTPVAAVETAASLEDMLEEPPVPVVVVNNPPSPEEPPVPAAAIESAPSLEDMLGESPAPIATVETVPSLEAMLEEPAASSTPLEQSEPEVQDPPPVLEPPTSELIPGLGDFLAEPEIPTPPPVAEALASELIPGLSDFMTEPQAPVLPPVAETPASELIPGLGDFMAEPQAPVPPPVAEGPTSELIPGLGDFLAEPEVPTPPPAVEAPVSESIPGLADFLAEPEVPAPPPVVEAPVSESVPGLADFLAEPEVPTPPPAVEAPVSESIPGLADFLAEPEVPAPPPVEVPVPESVPGLADFLAEPEVPTPPPAVEAPVSESVPGLADFLAQPEVPAPPPVEVPVPESVPGLADFLAEPEVPAPPPAVEAPVSESIPGLADFLAEPEVPAPPPVVEAPVSESIPGLADFLAEPEVPAPPPAVEAPVSESVPGLADFLAEPEVPAPPPEVEAPVSESIPGLADFLAEPEVPAPPPVVEAPVSESVPGLADFLAEPEAPAPPPVVESPVSESVPGLADFLAEPEAPTPPPVVESPVSASASGPVDFLTEPEVPAPQPVVEAPLPEPEAAPSVAASTWPSAEPVLPAATPVAPVAPAAPVLVQPEVLAPAPAQPEDPGSVYGTLAPETPFASESETLPGSMAAFSDPITVSPASELFSTAPIPAAPISAPQPVEPAPPPIAEPAVAAPGIALIPVEEEIEEYDSYQFDPNSGPPAPPWTAWSTSERTRLDEVIARLQDQSPRLDFGYLVDSVRTFLSRGRSGYLLIEGEPGVGKSFFGNYLETTAGQIHTRGLRIGYAKVARRPHGDHETFIEAVNDALSSSEAPRTQRISALERLALHDLAQQFPSPRRQARFSAFLTGLTVHNRGPVLIYLDEIDRRQSYEPGFVSPADFLPDTLPDNVYLVVTYRPDCSEAFLAKLQKLSTAQTTRMTLEPALAEYRAQLDGELSRWLDDGALRQRVAQSEEFRLHFGRLTAQACAQGLFPREGLPSPGEVYPRLVEAFRAQLPDKFASLQHFLMSLCASFQPIAWDDIDQWGSSVDTIALLVEKLPGLLVQKKIGPFVCIDLAHESLRDYLINQNREAFGSVCRILTGWVVHTIQSSGELQLQSEQGREWARQAFYRLYRWSLLCSDNTTLEWVVRNKELQKKRIAVSQALENSARAHQKLSLLDLWVESLRQLVEDHGQQDLRDELAWALNSRGLTYLNLHRRQRALVDLDKSVELFRVLVEDERQTQFRNGLAAAYNRRSELHFSLQSNQEALHDSSQAVQLFTDLVEDMGRADLRPQLALAHRNQATIWSALNSSEDATRSMQAAILIFDRLAEEGNDRSILDGAVSHLQLAQYQQQAGQHTEALQEAGKAVVIFNSLAEKNNSGEIRSHLERAHFVRGFSYLHTDQPEKANRDYSKSIMLGTQLLDEGRLDQRDKLAQAYSLRAETQARARQPKEAVRDLSKATDLRQKLIQEGRAEQKLELAREYLSRARVYQQDRQEELAQSDLTSAQTLLGECLSEGQDVGSLLFESLTQRAELSIQLGRYPEVVSDSEQALKLIEAQSGETRALQARLHSLRGEGYRRLLQSDRARSDLQATIRLYTELLQTRAESEYLVGLAQAYSDLARVSLRTGHLDQAEEEVNRCVSALEVPSLDQSSGAQQARLAQAYSTRAEVLERQGQHQQARQEVRRALDIYANLVDKDDFRHLLDEEALAFRLLAKILLSQNEPNPAREACEQSTRRYKELWSRDRKGPWLDELSRTQVVHSAVSVILKEYGAAEEEIQRSLEHFSGLLDRGRPEYFDDVFQTSMQRAQNFMRVGLWPKATEELSRLSELVRRTSAQFEKVDFREAQARVTRTRAQVHAQQQNYEQAYNDYEGALQTLQPLVVDESLYHLGRDLSEIYRERAKMLISAGHAQPGLADLTQATQVLGILLSQGRNELRRPLAQTANERAQVYLAQQQVAAAVEDLNLGIELTMSLLSSSDDPEVFAELAAMLAQRGRCYQQAQQIELASADFEKAVQLYTRLVEVQGRQDLSAVLAECLLSHLSLSGQGIEDPERLRTLVRAVRLVTQQAKDGKQVEESFVVDSVTAVRNSLAQHGQQVNNDLADSVFKLVEAVLQLPKATYNWVNLTELLSQSMQYLDALKGPKYMALLCLCCVSCGREVQSLGAGSLPRLIYYLSLLGITLGSERPSEQLSLVGNAFSALIEQLARQRLDEQQSLALRQLVTTWQQLPAGYPAAANVSRGVLTALLRAT